MSHNFKKHRPLLPDSVAAVAAQAASAPQPIGQVLVVVYSDGQARVQSENLSPVGVVNVLHDAQSAALRQLTQAIAHASQAEAEAPQIMLPPPGMKV